MAAHECVIAVCVCVWDCVCQLLWLLQLASYKLQATGPSFHAASPFLRRPLEFCEFYWQIN